MNRRHFISTMGGAATAASLFGREDAFGAEDTTSLYAKGLVMVSFEHPEVLRLGFPEAPEHRATLIARPRNGGQREVRLKGAGIVQTAAASMGRMDYRIPELIRMQELYGAEIRSRIQDCPITLSIPYGAIKRISAANVSTSRYKFVRSDNGREITTFRPRQIAETLKIELLSEGTLALDGGKSTIALNTMKELHAEYTPTKAPPENVDAFTAHFPHYFAYLDRPKNAGFDAVPLQLGGSPASATPHVGNHFARLWPYMMCFIIGI